MRSRTVGELRDDAKTLIPCVELEQVYAVNTSLRVHSRSQTTPFNCATDLRVKGEHANGRVETWARYETTAHADAEEAEADSSTAVWTAIVEGVAVFTLDDPEMQISDDQLEAFALLVGMPILHPFAREWTQTLTGHSQYPAFTLGLIESPAEFDPGHVIDFPDR